MYSKKYLAGSVIEIGVNMSYHEKRAIVSMVSSVLITVFYSIFLYQRYLVVGSESVNDPRFWGAAFLVFILVSIVANIIITIIFTIIYRITTNEEEPSFSDERDKLIELKGSRNALYVFSLGVVLSMVSLVFYMPLYLMFILITYSGLLSSLVDDTTQFYLYRRGF
jgi:hypothetical protein